MPRTIKVATVQMDVSQAPRNERLERAHRLIDEAARAGAQLVVLPELFNTGYAYDDLNFELSESADGPTTAWMKKTSKEFSIHLAGTLLMRDAGEIYNSLLLFDPTGRSWRYDKNYPWAWESGYFRKGRGTSVAHTDLGDIGIMICWDVAHLNLWKQYAGKVDLLLISSCPPDGGNPVFVFPDGETFAIDDLGNWMSSLKDGGRLVFCEQPGEQTAWLGVPAVSSGACGRFRSGIPRPKILVWGFSILAPKFFKHRSQADQMQVLCGMVPSCRVINADGGIIAERTQAQGEGFILADVALADSKSMPAKPQPPAKLSQGFYFIADVLVPFLMKSVYRKGLKKV
jgi:predicted amidohydrolase